MKQKQIILTALTFSAGGEKIGKGMVITEGTERFAPQETPELLQLGRFRWDDHAGERFESGRPYDAEYERAGGWWVTFSQNGFLLRSVPGSGKETQHGLRRSVCTRKRRQGNEKPPEQISVRAAVVWILNKMLQPPAQAGRRG